MRLFASALLVLGSASAAPTLQVAYPPAEYRVTHDHIILQGHTDPAAHLSIDGKAVATGPDGLFMQWWPLKQGLNVVKVVARQDKVSSSQTLRLTYDAPRPLPTRPSILRASSLKPAADVTFYGAPAELRNVILRFQASPNGRASVKVGAWPAVSMPEEAGNGWYSVNLALPAGTWYNLEAQFTFTGQDGKTLRATAPGRISSEAAPRAAQVSAADMGLAVNPATTAFDTGAGAHDQLFPRWGENLTVWRQDGNALTVQGVTGYATAPAAALSLLPAGTPLPAAQLEPPTVTETPNEWQIRWPSSEAVLFDITEGRTQAGQATLSLKLANAAGAAGETVAATPEAVGLRWNGPELLATLPQAQLWGYWANYEPNPDNRTALVLHVRKAPFLNPAQPLAGRIILIDPGHGGNEWGGAGSLGVPEKDMVLPIARRVAQLLRLQGADARLTRNTDRKVALYDRPLMAEQLQADMLISIHANALPDGIDPRTHKGLEVHTYHPMTYPLARQLLGSITAVVPDLSISNSSTERDPALSPGLMVSNLALTRPSTQRSVLIELAYLTDAGDLRKLMNPATQEAFAQGIAQGIAADYAAQVGAK